MSASYSTGVNFVLSKTSTVKLCFLNVKNVKRRKGNVREHKQATEKESLFETDPREFHLVQSGDLVIDKLIVFKVRLRCRVDIILNVILDLLNLAHQ